MQRCHYDRNQSVGDGVMWAEEGCRVASPNWDVFFFDHNHNLPGLCIPTLGFVENGAVGPALCDDVMTREIIYPMMARRQEGCRVASLDWDIFRVKT
jgi:hypothetical protein